MPVRSISHHGGSARPNVRSAVAAEIMDSSFRR
jgi:hypothetical protein